ncbi:MAG: hypothetical protein KF799_05500 [Bdellovibrionales bacterium]|nr:hypothetical protein [Bdellovibrionales bacterium]
MNRISVFTVMLALSLLACAKRAPRPEEVRKEDRQTIASALTEEMSLKADRDELAELRKDIPAETQRANDELALQLGLMKQGTETPATVRDRFQTLVQRKRSDFRKKVERLRNDYRQEETRRREDFTVTQKRTRENFMKRKRDRTELQRFSSDQERDRSRFFADERDRRSNFEAEVNARSRDFESYMRERSNEFNEQYRLYSKKFSEKPKEKKAVTGDEFQKLDSLPAKELGTEE